MFCVGSLLKKQKSKTERKGHTIAFAHGHIDDSYCLHWMAKRCLVETCKREAETYCYHCSHDVCTKHYLEHKKSIQEQLHPFVDEINLIYDRLRPDNKNQTSSVPQCFINACSQLDKWREACHHCIEITYDRIRHQINDIMENHKHDETQKAMKNLESLEKIREQLKELLKEGDVTYRQLETMKQQLEEIKKREQESIKYPDIRIITQKIDVDKCVSVTTNIKHPNEKQHQTRNTQDTSSNKYVFIQVICSK